MKNLMMWFFLKKLIYPIERLFHKEIIKINFSYTFTVLNELDEENRLINVFVIISHKDISSPYQCNLLSRKYITPRLFMKEYIKSETPERLYISYRSYIGSDSYKRCINLLLDLTNNFRTKLVEDRSYKVKFKKKELKLFLQRTKIWKL